MKSYRTPWAQWITSPNYSLNRDGHDMAIAPAYIVLHTTVCPCASAVGRFQNGNPAQPGGRASANYIVKLDGGLIQMVDEKDGAWHCGDYGVNMDAIGIEHEDGSTPANPTYNLPRPDALYATSAKLVAEICKRYSLPCRRGNAAAGVSGLIDHRSVSPTGCPDALDTNRIIAMAAAILNPPAVLPEWKRNLVAEALSVKLAKSVELVNMETLAHVADVLPSPTGLETAYRTSVSGVAYRMTSFSVTAGKPNGIRAADIDAAKVPDVPPADPIKDALDAMAASLTGQGVALASLRTALGK